MGEKILLATQNPGKLREFKALLSDLGEALLSPREVGIRLEVEESGQTYRENAVLKARAFAAASGLMALADDSGLEVDALGGAPGVRSARFAPQPGATDADRRAYLLQRLQGRPQPWRARFRCWIALATPEGALYFGEGTCEGQIIPEERGQGGFGYDPIFLLEERGVTMAELTAEEKNRLSHRALAVEAIRPVLRRLLRGEPSAG